MDFTREPVVECVITPKEGSKLVVRSSKGSSQEEYFVDSVEIVCFGSAFFFRTLEKPKSFLLPVSDYEILEVREARMVLKHTATGERQVKALKPKQPEKKKEPEKKVPEVVEEKKPERRRQTRRRKLALQEDHSQDSQKFIDKQKLDMQEPIQADIGSGIESPEQKKKLRAILPPPPSLISETIGKYRDDEMFKDAFFTPTEEQLESMPAPQVEEPVVVQQEPATSEGDQEPKKRSFWDFAKELTKTNNTD